MDGLPAPVLEERIVGPHGIRVLTDDILFERCGVRVAFTGRAGGVSAPPLDELNLGAYVDDDPGCLLENRLRMLEALEAGPLPLVVPLQVHGTHVMQVDGPADVVRAQDEAFHGADAILGVSDGVAVQLGFADCLPLIAVSPTGRFAVIHAGWRGAVAGIAGKAVAALVEADRARGDAGDPASFNLYIGPYLHAECFETGPEVIERFVDRYGEEVLVDGNVSLAAAVTIDMERAGIDANRIADAGVCTKCHPDVYFSYRASGGVCGRHAAVAFARR